MEELIKNTKYSEEIINIESYDQNELFLTIIKLQRYDLLSANSINPTIADDDISLTIIEELLSDEDKLYYLKDDYSFDETTKSKIAQLVLKNYTSNARMFSNFLYNFFDSKEDRNNFIKNNRQRFVEYLYQEEDNLAYPIVDDDEFINIILSEKKIKHIKNIENYSLRNLKLLSELLEKNNPLPYYCGNDRVVKNIFNNIDNLTNKELNNLLKLLTYKTAYIRKTKDKTDIFTNYIQENINRLIECIEETNYIPKCLVENKHFTAECIKRNRIDIAAQCILPKEILDNEQLSEAYCKQLQIEKKDFYSRIKQLTEYSKRNNNIFNTFISSMLKDQIFTLPPHHLERFINDVDIQMSFNKMTKKELEIISIILNKFDYKEYDVTHMLSNVIKNIHNYKELVNNIDISTFNDKKITSFINIVQHPENIYQVTKETELETIKELQKKKYLEERKYNDINRNKENLCQYLLNLSLKDAKTINQKYCYNRKNKLLNDLRNSQLPENIFNMLSIINAIVECETSKELDNCFIRFIEQSIYDHNVPVETYLRSQYAKLYTDTLYKVETPVEESDSKPNKLLHSTEYNGQKVNICIPRDEFALLVHCVGTCSNIGDETDQNYQKDWEYRPQIHDHLVACSYINHQKIYSFRSSNSTIAYGFNTIEGGALHGMGNTDIDSIGIYATTYNSSDELMNQGDRAAFLIPSQMIKTTEGYNEIVIERRNLSTKNKYYKKTPDYIIMSVDSIENASNFTSLNDLFSTELSHLTEEEQEQIRTDSNASKIISILTKEDKKILEEKTINEQLESIKKAKYYEQCLKAATEFNIPIVIIDRQYYFNKLLNESLAYDEQTKEEIEKIYKTSDEERKRTIFNNVYRGECYEKIKPKESKQNPQKYVIEL